MVERIEGCLLEVRWALILSELMGLSMVLVVSNSFWICCLATLIGPFKTPAEGRWASLKGVVLLIMLSFSLSLLFVLLLAVNELENFLFLFFHLDQYLQMIG